MSEEAETTAVTTTAGTTSEEHLSTISSPTSPWQDAVEDISTSTTTATTTAEEPPHKDHSEDEEEKQMKTPLEMPEHSTEINEYLQSLLKKHATKTGMLHKKNEKTYDGVKAKERGWKTYFVEVRGEVMFFYGEHEAPGDNKKGTFKKIVVNPEDFEYQMEDPLELLKRAKKEKDEKKKNEKEKKKEKEKEKGHKRNKSDAKSDFEDDASDGAPSTAPPSSSSGFASPPLSSSPSLDALRTHLDDQPRPLGAIFITDGTVCVASDYKKRKSVFKFVSKRKAEYMFQPDSAEVMAGWIMALESGGAKIVSDDHLEQDSETFKEKDKDKDKEKDKEKDKHKDKHSQAELTKEDSKSIVKRFNIRKLRGSNHEASTKTPTAETLLSPSTENKCFGGRIENQIMHEEYGIPLVVEKCVRTIDEYGLESVGIYRLSGNANVVQDLRQKLNQDIESVDFSDKKGYEDDINVIAGLLKCWLRELPEPLLTFYYYDSFIAAARISDYNDRMLSLQHLLHLLPPENFATMEYLAGHLARVAEKSDINKMAASNLAIVFGPNLLRSPTETIADMMADMSLKCTIVEAIIQQPVWMFSKNTDENATDQVAEDSQANATEQVAEDSQANATEKVAEDSQANATTFNGVSDNDDGNQAKDAAVADEDVTYHSNNDNGDSANHNDSSHNENSHDDGNDHEENHDDSGNYNDANYDENSTNSNNNNNNNNNAGEDNVQHMDANSTTSYGEEPSVTNEQQQDDPHKNTSKNDDDETTETTTATRTAAENDEDETTEAATATRTAAETAEENDTSSSPSDKQSVASHENQGEEDHLTDSTLTTPVTANSEFE